MKIKSITGREFLDSRANPTVAAILTLEDGRSVSAIVPSGASTGQHEAVELRDGDVLRYGGAGVLKAIDNIEKIIQPALIGLSVLEQELIDRKMMELDASANKSVLGANAILAVSLATARAGALVSNLPLYEYLSRFNPDFTGTYQLPVPMMNVLNGGRHANWATDIQEYMILPVGVKSFSEAVRACSEIYQSLKKILKDSGYGLGVGDEGGFAPAVKNNEESFALLAAAVSAAGYQLGRDIVLGIDAAASEFYQNGTYLLKKEGKSMNGVELADFYAHLAEKYPILSWEDVFSEDDWSNFQTFTATYPKVQVVGDDLYATNIERLARGIKEKSSNSILIKLNQIGTLTETIAAILLARTNGLTTVISHRSGETEDDFIADLAVGLNAGQIKAGAPARGERTAKYNRLITIEAELGERAVYTAFPFI